jgi:hypothetical protein
VDYTYQYEFAKMASENGVNHYALVSSTGANKDSCFFYLKMKGALEEEIKKLSFTAIQIFQPQTLIRQTDLLRPAEKRVIRMLNTLNRFGTLRSQKPLPVSVLAKKMIDGTQHNTQDITIYRPKDIEE